MTEEGKYLGYSPDKVKITLNGQDIKVDSVSRDALLFKLKKGIKSGDVIISINAKEIKKFPLKVSE